MRKDTFWACVWFLQIGERFYRVQRSNDQFINSVWSFARSPIRVVCKYENGLGRCTESNNRGELWIEASRV